MSKIQNSKSKIQASFKLQISICLCAVAVLLGGCTHVRNDFMGKQVWYWSAEAKAQRQADAEDKARKNYHPEDFSPLPTAPHVGPEHVPTSKVELPPIPRDDLPRREGRDVTPETTLASIDGSAFTKTVRVSWVNEATPLSKYLISGLAASPDRKAWSVVTNMPYATNCEVRLSGRPATEYYRVFWGWK